MHRRFHDQHGRIWEGPVEKETGHPCATLRPRFTAPWVPPQDLKYFKFDTDIDDPYLIVLEYPTLLEDLRQSHEEYQRLLRVKGQQLYKDAFDPERPTQVLLDQTGHPPASPLPVLAAMRNDQWVLGFSSEKPAWAGRVFAEPVPVADKLWAEFAGQVDEDRARASRAQRRGQVRQSGGLNGVD